MLEKGGDTLEHALNELDEAFYAYPDDLTAMLHDYVLKHREQFSSTPIDF